MLFPHDTPDDDLLDGFQPRLARSGRAQVMNALPGHYPHSIRLSSPDYRGQGSRVINRRRNIVAWNEGDRNVVDATVPAENVRYRAGGDLAEVTLLLRRPQLHEDDPNETKPWLLQNTADCFRAGLTTISPAVGRNTAQTNRPHLMPWNS